VGWSAVTGHLGLAPFVMFAIIFLWTPPHFWALAVRYRDDYANAHVPMLPSIAALPTVTRRILAYVLVLWVSSLLLVPAAHLNAGYAVAALVLGGLFCGYAWALLRDPSPRRAMKLFGFSITYLTALFIAMGADAVIRIR
jgi:heme o synthase